MRQGTCCWAVLCVNALSTVRITIQECLDRLSKKTIDPEAVATATQEFRDSLEESGLDPCQKHLPKQVRVTYRNHAYEVPSTGPMDFFRSSVHAMVCGLAVDKGLMEPLWAESVLLNT